MTVEEHAKRATERLKEIGALSPNADLATVQSVIVEEFSISGEGAQISDSDLALAIPLSEAATIPANPQVTPWFRADAAVQAKGT